MPNPQFISEKSLTYSEVKEIVSSSESENYRITKAKEFFKEIKNVLSPDKAKELKEKLEQLEITRLKDDIISRITDFLPKDIETLKMTLVGSIVTLTKAYSEKIVEVVKIF